MISEWEEQIEAQGGFNSQDVDPPLIYWLAGWEDRQIADMIWRVSENFRSPKHHTAQLLAAAARKNANSPLVAWLLRKGTAANGPTPKLNALTAACAGNADRNVALLLSAGANPNAQDERGRTSIETVRFLGPCGKNIASRRSRILEDLARAGARFNPADLCLLDALRRSVGLGPRTLELLEEVEIYEEIGNARLAPRRRACYL